MSKHKSSGKEVSYEPEWLEPIWARVVRPSSVGLMLLVAGGLLMIAPWLQAPRLWTGTWWSWPMHAPDLMQIATMLVSVALVCALAIAWSCGVEGALREGCDVFWRAQERAQLEADTRRSGVWTHLALTLMTCGVLLGLGSWAQLVRDVPPAEGLFSIGQEVESVSAIVRGKPLKLMLPRRLKVHHFEADSRLGVYGAVRVSFVRPKQEDDGEQQVLVSGQSVDVDNKRFTYVGVRQDVKNPRAVFSGKDEKASIVAAGLPKDRIKVKLDGPEYTIVQLSVNHLGFMGPAAQVNSKEHGTFWVYQRERQESQDVLTPSELKLLRLEAAPAAVFLVSPVLPFWPLILAGVLFTLGFGVLLVVPHRAGRKQFGLVSINDAGALASSEYALFERPQEHTHEHMLLLSTHQEEK